MINFPQLPSDGHRATYLSTIARYHHTSTLLLRTSLHREVRLVCVCVGGCIYVTYIFLAFLSKLFELFAEIVKFTGRAHRCTRIACGLVVLHPKANSYS